MLYVQFKVHIPAVTVIIAPLDFSEICNSEIFAKITVHGPSVSVQGVFFRGGPPLENIVVTV